MVSSSVAVKFIKEGRQNSGNLGSGPSSFISYKMNSDDRIVRHVTSVDKKCMECRIFDW